MIKFVMFQQMRPPLLPIMLNLVVGLELERLFSFSQLVTSHASCSEKYRDEAIAPTGFVANIVNGTTHNLLFKIPVGENFKKAPSDLSNTNVSTVNILCKICKNTFLLIMDKETVSNHPFGV